MTEREREFVQARLSSNAPRGDDPNFDRSAIIRALVRRLQGSAIRHSLTLQCVFVPSALPSTLAFHGDANVPKHWNVRLVVLASLDHCCLWVHNYAVFAAAEHRPSTLSPSALFLQLMKSSPHPPSLLRPLLSSQASSSPTSPIGRRGSLGCVRESSRHRRSLTDQSRFLVQPLYMLAAGLVVISSFLVLALVKDKV